MRILLVEDNYQLHQLLKKSLQNEGYAVDDAFDGLAGLEYAEIGPYDAIILDILLPNKDGLSICRTLRSQGKRTPILMLTARDAVSDRVKGLDSGADDYLVKPFDMSELLARLRALLRRDAPDKSGVLRVGDLIADPATHYVEREGCPIVLSTRGFSLLEYFMRHPNQVLTREMVSEHLWSYDVIGTLNAVDVAVRRLRRQIDEPFTFKMLETVRGAGYRLRAPDFGKESTKHG
ncbi:DNA-binding response OmpR family regulator [Thermosporothrix hazakensis]|jgi:DNA-binding response OmpR family regulator|uniref:DNA-binding response OmpR family regulator n=1 Tax=Thermosporothrix hazakensis TaxID=644383 RepID=A0A326U6V0_THEHA|nr:response regulator transcription factor [Thermosporothrix hazakensis]PZW29262.1 DNA-binding response OmpR family regulator [Thermosporothrix hazakensis]GCE45386.1 DNA-binding response regulator [Thermosporothrix hazakensis]